jgi:hypothetical protein
MTANIPYDAIKKSVTFIYRKEGAQYRPNGTGFLVRVDVESKDDAYVIYLVTAKHVLHDGNENFLPTIAIRLNKRDGSAAYVEMPTERIKIYTHSDADVDIGLFPLSPSPMLYDFKVIPENIIANKETLKDLKIREVDDVFFSGLFESHMGQKKNQPIFRFGKVALISDEKIEWPETKGVKFLDLFLMEFFSFGGNSGSPVFFQPSSESNIAKNNNQSPLIYLAGLVRGSVKVKEVFLPDTYLSQNTGIAAVIPSYKLYEILHYEEVKANRNSGNVYAQYPEEQ